MSLFYTTIFISILYVVHISCLKVTSIEKAYYKGVNAYTGERWSECIAQFEESIHLYNVYKSTVINCRLQCYSQQYDNQVKDNIEDLQIYESFLNKRNCLTKCHEKSFEDGNLLNELEGSVLVNMQARKPYEYLHLCYFQMYSLPKAASAAYTYFVAHPNDETMKHNVKYYIEQPEVDEAEVTDLLNDKYTSLYRLGLKAYNQSNYADTVVNMESAIIDYFNSENVCRMECDRQPEQQWSPEIVITISNSIASLLHCRQQCQDKLKNLLYNSGIEFLADVLNYLQMSFFHLKKFDKAAEAVASYLKLLPDDQDMLDNKEFYSGHANKSAFVERSDIIFYSKRDAYEKILINTYDKQTKINNNLNSL